ncbi:MAG: copper-binding protein [Deltaproteobacteria bacterium]|nr:copper-binding protein [Deltaproteobacteria bacterium]
MKNKFAYWQVVFLGVVLGAGSLAAFDLPDPADPAALVPGIAYRSAFSDYRPYQEQKPLSWKQINEDVTGIPGATGHAGHETAMPASPKEPAAEPAGHAGHGAAATTGSETSSSSAAPTAAPAGAIAATGVIRRIDKADGKVVIAHEPIAALGWPGMTMIFRLKDPATIKPYQAGDRVNFYLEKSASDYVISGFRKPSEHDLHGGGKADEK